jgi:hypothetical protein
VETTGGVLKDFVDSKSKKTSGMQASMLVDPRSIEIIVAFVFHAKVTPTTSKMRSSQCMVAELDAHLQDA